MSSFVSEEPELARASLPVDFIAADMGADYVEALTKVRAELSRHRFWPDIEGLAGRTSASQGGGMVFRWRAKAGNTADAVLQVVLLGQQRLLWRVRRCLNCQRWFFARFKHQRHCKMQCQQAYYRDDPQWRENRRKYMQNYRRLTS